MANESTDVSAEIRPPSPPNDWLLETLVMEANARKSTFVDVTLFVKGLMVSGTLAGISEFYRAAIGVFSPSGAEDEPAEGTWGEFFKRTMDEVAVDVADPVRHTHADYVHLKNARVYVSGQRPVPNNEGVWWRGRLSEVDAFWFGRLSVS